MYLDRKSVFSIIFVVFKTKINKIIMATITLKGNEIHTFGTLPVVGSMVSNFKLINNDLGEVSLSDVKGSRLVLNIFPSLDTGICAASVRNFNKMASSMDNTKVLCVSRDLPFAQKRFCGAEGIEDVITVSDFKDGVFGKVFGVEIVDGPMAGLHSRAVVVVDETGKIIYTEQVPEIVQEPNYEAAIASLK